MDDLWRLRLGQERRPSQAPTSGGAPAFVGRVLSTGTNIAVGKFLMVRPSTVTGLETEGAAGAYSDLTSGSVPVYLLGPGKPATGNYVVCRYVGYRWVTEFTGQGQTNVNTGSIPGCYCSPIPATLTMTSADPSCNYAMFQSCTIQFYNPPPAMFAPLALGATAFLSTTSFPDPVGNDARFWYLLNCVYNQFTLTRVYLESPFGSPYRDGILYTWLTGGAGNACSATSLQLINGQPFAGSDLTCLVTITGTD